LIVCCRARGDGGEEASRRAQTAQTHRHAPLRTLHPAQSGNENNEKKKKISTVIKTKQITKQQQQPTTNNQQQQQQQQRYNNDNTTTKQKPKKKKRNEHNKYFKFELSRLRVGNGFFDELVLGSVLFQRR
jgi:hypothetical protein